jgi:hypothetical protein
MLWTNLYAFAFVAAFGHSCVLVVVTASFLPAFR